jgi:hypothetical protein
MADKSVGLRAVDLDGYLAADYIKRATGAGLVIMSTSGCMGGVIEIPNERGGIDVLAIFPDVTLEDVEAKLPPVDPTET